MCRFVYANVFEMEKQSKYKDNKTNFCHCCCDYTVLEGEKFKAFIMARTQNLTGIIALGATFVRILWLVVFSLNTQKGFAVVLVVDLHASEMTVRQIRRDS